MKAKKKKPFSLLELFLTLLFISFLAFFFSINLKEAKEKETFAMEIEKITSKFNFAQYLMLAADSSTTLSFDLKEAPQKIILFLTTEKSLKKELKKEAERKLTLSSVESISFLPSSTPPFEEKEQNLLSFYFFSSGFTMSEGTLTITPKNKNLEKKIICLSGSPKLIQAKNEDTNRVCEEEVDPLVTEKITLDTFDLLNKEPIKK